MTCIIIEDEKLIALSLEKMLKDEGITVLGISSDIEESVELIDRLKPDIIFLDINLGKANGFEILRRISHNPCVIFTTAYSEYAVKAFEENAIDYILKPIKKERLKMAIEKVIKAKEQNQLKQTSEFLDLFKKLSVKTPQKINIETANEIHLVDVDEIIYLKSEEKYTFVFLKEEVLKTREALKDIETKLPQDKLISVHKSYIISLKYIRKIIKNYFGGMAIEMTNGDIIPVGRNYKESLKNTIGL
ncbi:MAG: LytTR family DNA-binding domain-containing protein [Fervidobacterium sp.]